MVTCGRTAQAYGQNTVQWTHPQWELATLKFNSTILKVLPYGIHYQLLMLALYCTFSP